MFELRRILQAMFVAPAVSRSFRFALLCAATAASVSLAGGYARAEEQRSYEVIVPFRNYSLVHDAEGLAASCGTSTSIRACTVFYARRLDCRCDQDDSGWRIHARAQFIPNIVLWQTSAMQHEIMHVNEVERAVADHLAELTAARFTSADECEERARRAAGSFTSAMDGFQRASNVRHHPAYNPEPLRPRP